MRKILYITAEGFDTPNPNNQMAEVMIRDFLEYGFSVHLIQSHRKGENADIPESLHKFKNLSCDTINRKIVDKTNFISRYLNDVAFSFQALSYWKRVSDVDVIYLQSNPTIIFSMILLKISMRKTPIVYSIYDIFPGHAHNIGVIRSKFVFEILRIIQKPCYKLPAVIIVLGEDMKAKVVEQGADPEKVFVIPAWFDINSTKEISIDDNKFIKKYAISSAKFIVQYAGTVGYVFNYHTVIELAKRIIDYENIVIHIIGDGNVKRKFIQETTNLNLTNIKFFPLQPVELVPDVYSECDIALIPLQKGVIGNGIPSKAPIIMACHRPIVNSVELNSKYAQMFNNNHIGISVDIDDYDKLAAVIIDLSRSLNCVHRMADNAYDFSRKNYSSTLSTLKLIGIFEGLVSAKL
ncbi:MAG: glycosyltransferase family 4 protein [Erysipelotrichaceae bacterium]|nr:glycosyltransferase family 4 protein [Erysipelotrichaceae bacterium]